MTEMNDPTLEAPIPTAPLESILCSESLQSRPPRLPDYEKENRALVKLMNALADSPNTIFQTLADTILEVTEADSAGLSLLTKDGKTPHVDGQRFYWPAIAGMWSPHVGGGTPRNFGPCGDVLDRNTTMLFTHWERRYPYLGRAVPYAEEGLLVPFYVDGKAVGTIWGIMHSDRRKFDAEDDRVMASLGKFASSAYEALMRIEDLKITAELAAANAELQVQVGLLQHLPVSAWTLKPDGTPEFVNQVWLDFSGQTLDFVRSHPEAWMTAVHPEDREMAARAFWEGVRSGEDFAIETRSLRAKDGSYRWHLQQAVVLRDAEGKVLKFVGTTTDIDDQKRAEEGLRNAQSELARVMGVMAMEQLTASIAHEVNQPLSGIMTNAGTCLRMLDNNPPNLEGARETARRTIRDANRASEVITRLRAFFSHRETAAESLDLNEAAREVIALSLSGLQKNDITVQADLAGGLPSITGDRIQLQQVILNLLRNAMDAMGGVDDRPRELFVKTEMDQGGQIQLSVKDSGVGFAPQDADKLFAAFHTTKTDGMGIGLSISRSIIEAHQGRLWATRNDGPGSTFSFSIPCWREGFADTEIDVNHAVLATAAA
jgi:PAS domain S-box-containing protein